MKLDYKESIALAKMADIMMKADGKIVPQEKGFYVYAMSKLDLSMKEADEVFEKAAEMTPGEAVTILDGMSTNEKTVAASFLGAMCVADGIAMESEVSKWRLICDLCRFPEMTIAQACMKLANEAD